MAFTIGKYGLGTLASLGVLLVAVYLTCVAFVFAVLGRVARLAGFSLWQFLGYIRREIVLVLGTPSSESALPRLLQRLEHLGCDRGVVGLVLPTGYSFNLDGTCIYLTLAAIFIAQALGIELTLGEQLVLLAVLLLTSKGAAGATGSGFITLAATLAALGGKVPVEGVGADPRCRPPQVGSTRGHQRDRQRRRLDGGREVGRPARRRDDARRVRRGAARARRARRARRGRWTRARADGASPLSVRPARGGAAAPAGRSGRRRR
jgi:hypothetical protein